MSLNSQSGAFFGAAFLPIFSMLCFNAIAGLLHLTGWSQAVIQQRLGVADTLLGLVLLLHFFAGAVLGGAAGAVIRSLSRSKRSEAREVCLSMSVLLLGVQLLALWPCVLRSTFQDRSWERDFLFLSLLLGAPLIWNLALLFYGLRLNEFDPNQNTRRE